VTRYEPAAKNVQPSRCQDGTRALGMAIGNVFPEFISLHNGYGCYSYRRQTSGTGWSLHAEGRALDVGVPGRHRDLGWQLGCELVRHRTVFGVMRVIWDRHIWSIEQLKGWRQLKPTSQQHTDHLHIEQYWEAARRSSAFQTLYEEHLRQFRADLAAGASH
jgi:hypothetical protein